jgi:hypothetical protein
MIRSALLLCAGLLAAACFACAQTPPPPPTVLPPPLPPVSASAVQPCDAPHFVAAVQVLTAAYNPNSSPYSPPDQNVQVNYPLRNEIKNDLTDAFTNAPQFFKNQLCALDGIYINPKGCSVDANNCKLVGDKFFNASWGFRSRNHADLNKRYISISAGLWIPGAGNYAKALSVYETAVFRQLLSLPPVNPGNPVPPYFGSSNQDNSWMTVLAALAHELGHVRWADINIKKDNPGRPYDFSYLNSCSGGSFFQNWNYPNDNWLKSKNNWRGFGNRESQGGGTPDHKAPPQLGDIFDPVKQNGALWQLYQAPQPWPSLFGALSPEEDFVESYVVAVLTGYQPNYGIPPMDRFFGPLKSLPLSVGGYNVPVDIPNDLVNSNKTELQRKMRCIPGYA